jgi:hypothetical protein
MPLPYKGPDGTLFQLLGYVVDAGRRFAAIADMKVEMVHRLILLVQPWHFRTRFQSDEWYSQKMSQCTKRRI